jgi:acetyl/propionyl-CoA carboxylase alpha subunit
MLAKLAVWAGTRADAVARMRRAIGEYRISGIRTNLNFFHRILEDPEFSCGKLDTSFLERLMERLPPRAEPATQIASLAAGVAEKQMNRPATAHNGLTGTSSPWLLAGRDQVQR